ncbi:MAG: glycosyltransferase family 4 protein [Oscillospiraceae bacterium]|nr:glycosyltransferase family 4 protein [Oscillospiraceae bacterium]
MAKILIFSGDDMSFYKFRKELIVRLHELGHEVVLATKFSDYEARLAELGCRTVDLDALKRRGANALQDLELIRAYKKIIRDFCPDVILTYTLKPRVYGDLAAGKKTPIINTITGMGAYTLNGGALAKIATVLDKVGLRNANHVFFQNVEARDIYLQRKLLKNTIPTTVVMGSGVNLETFPYQDYPDHEGVDFAFVGRIMKDKGVEELFYAAEQLKKNYGEHVRVHIFGFYEENYKPVIEDLQARGIICYHGFVSDLQPRLKNMDCIVLPSYHEGVGNAIQEASASGRPVIASNIPGCNTVVEDGLNGYLCKARDKEDLLEQMEKIMGLSAREREEMGKQGREKMVREHDRNKIIETYINVIHGIVGHKEAAER